MVIALFCCSTRTLACIILVSASKLRFKGSYSDELRSPHKLKFAGAPNGGFSSSVQQKRRAKTLLLLLNQDSNPDRQNQNL